MKYDVVVVGGATEDITFYTSEGVLIDNKKDILRQKLLGFEYGAKIKIDRSDSFYGGGAANAAVNMSSLGLKVGGIITIGDDERGEMIKKNLRKRGVDTKSLQVIKGQSGFSFTLIGPGNEHVIFSNRAANNALKITDADLKALKSAKWVYVSSLSGKWASVCDRVFSLPGAKIAWNPGNTQLCAGVKKIKKYLEKTAILSLNKDESTELVLSDPRHKDKSHSYLSDVGNLLRIIKSYGVGIVIVTNGLDGAYAFDGMTVYHQPIKKSRKVADTTGVGDCFASSFVAGYELSQGDIKRSMRLAMANTSSLVEKPGAQNGFLSSTQAIKYLK